MQTCQYPAFILTEVYLLPLLRDIVLSQKNINNISAQKDKSHSNLQYLEKYRSLAF